MTPILSQPQQREGWHQRVGDGVVEELCNWLIDTVLDVFFDALVEGIVSLLG